MHFQESLDVPRQAVQSPAARGRTVVPAEPPAAGRVPAGAAIARAGLIYS